MSDKTRNRIQNLAIAALTLSAVFLFTSLPLFGPLSDRSLLALAQERLHRENIAESETVDVPRIALPVRMVYTNDFARLGAGALTTLSDEFEHAGTYLGEAIGSAGGMEPVGEGAFLAAMRGEGLYFDFTAAFPAELLSDLLGVTPSGPMPERVRRMLLSPTDGDALLFVQDGDGGRFRFSTAVSSAALVDFLASQSGKSADFAFLLGPDYERLSPYTILLSDPPSRGALSVSNALAGGEDAFLRLAGFNSHTENRFTESSGTVIVREVSSALYLRPNGDVDYQGGEASPDSLYFVPAAVPGAPTLPEAAAAAQAVAATLLRDLLGDAALYMSGIREDDEGRYEIAFDLMAPNGTPICFSDGSHAAVVTTTGSYVSAFSLKARRYTLTEQETLLLPVSLSSAIARVWDGAELSVAYVDAGGEDALPVWIAEQEGAERR